MPPPENRRRRASKVRTPDTSSWSADERAAHEREAMLRTPIAEMDLPVRVVNALEDNNVLLAEDLMTQTYQSLMGMKNFGDKTLKEVKAALTALGLTPPQWRKPPKEKKPQRSKDSWEGMLKFW